MEEYLLYVGYIGIIALTGIICVYLSRKLRINQSLLLILAGMGLANIKYKGIALINIPDVVVWSFLTVSLAAVMLDSSRRIRFNEIDSSFKDGLKAFSLFLILNLILVSVFNYFTVKPYSYLLSIFFSIVVSESAVHFNLVRKSRVLYIIENESKINNMIVLFLAWLFVAFLQENKVLLWAEIYRRINPFFMSLIIGIAFGAIAGIVLFKYIKKIKSHYVAPIVIITIAVLAYILSELMGGMGIATVLMMGLFFGNSHIKDKKRFDLFSDNFSRCVDIGLFVLIGMTIKISDLNFLVMSVSSFIFYMLVSFLTMITVFMNSRLKLKEIIYMALHIPKGTVFGIVLLALIFGNFTGFEMITNMLFAFLVYSLIVSTLINLFSKYFVNVKV